MRRTNSTRQRLAAGGLALLVAASASWACGASDSPASPSAVQRPPSTTEPSKSDTSIPSKTPTPLSYLPFHLAGTRTQVLAVDALLGAVESGDPAQVMALVSVAGVPCATNASGVGAPPSCLPGQAAGTLMTVFPFPVCEGRFVERPEVERSLRVMVFAKTPRLYAVYEPGGDIFGEAIRPQYLAVFGFDGQQPAGVWRVSVRDGIITGMSYCEYGLPALSDARRVILAAP